MYIILYSCDLWLWSSAPNGILQGVEVSWLLRAWAMGKKWRKLRSFAKRRKQEGLHSIIGHCPMCDNGSKWLRSRLSVSCLPAVLYHWSSAREPLPQFHVAPIIRSFMKIWYCVTGFLSCFYRPNRDNPYPIPRIVVAKLLESKLVSKSLGTSFLRSSFWQHPT